MPDVVTLNREANKRLMNYLAPNERPSCARCMFSIPKQNGMMACTNATPMPHVSKHGICDDYRHTLTVGKK